MSDLINIAKVELNTLSAFQQILHFPASEDEEIDSRFSYQFKKTSWSTHLPEKLKASSSEGSITYTANSKFDFLLHSYLMHKLPAYRVMEGYRNTIQIAWPHNVAHNISKGAHLRFDDDSAQKLNNVWIDIHSQFFMKPGFRDHYNIMVGNIPFLEDWSEFLPAYPVICPQPWYYARHEAVAIPLFLCSLSRVTHTYTVRTKLSEILRMRAYDRKTNSWREIPCNWKYLEGVNEQESLPYPEMWGRYTRITDAEREWRRSLPHEVYSEDVIAITTDNASQFGSSVPVNLHSDAPVKGMFWVAENTDASRLNNFSNYTTNTADLFKGWNPVKNITLTYGGVTRISTMEHDHFDRAEPWYKFPSPPSEPGYNAYSFGYDTTSLMADVGVVLDGLDARLSCILGNNDPFLSKIIDRRRSRVDETDDLIPEETIENTPTNNKRSPNFEIHVLLLVTRMIRFTNSDKVEIVEIAGTTIPPTPQESVSTH